MVGAGDGGRPVGHNRVADRPGRGSVRAGRRGDAVGVGRGGGAEQRRGGAAPGGVREVVAGAVERAGVPSADGAGAGTVVVGGGGAGRGGGGAGGAAAKSWRGSSTSTALDMGPFILLLPGEWGGRRERARNDCERVAGGWVCREGEGLARRGGDEVLGPARASVGRRTVGRVRLRSRPAARRSCGRGTPIRSPDAGDYRHLSACPVVSLRGTRTDFRTRPSVPVTLYLPKRAARAGVHSRPAKFCWGKKFHHGDTEARRPT